MRAIFMGAPQFAVPTLDALIDLGAEVVAVYTRAPKPAGRRGLELTKTPVHARADALGLAVFTPTTLRNDKALEQFQSLKADVAVVAAYGLILPSGILLAPRLGSFNMHGSLLPHWRGAAPIQRAIMAGDAETGVGFMRMEEGLDTGPVAREARTPIRPSDTAGDLAARLSALAAQLLRDVWLDLQSDRLIFSPQSLDGVAYARKIEKEETPVDWRGDAKTARNHIHGLSPSPGAYSVLRAGDQEERIKFLRAETTEGRGEPGTILDASLTVACGDGAIRALEAQRAGKGPMSGLELMRGGRLMIGDKFKAAAELRPARPASV